MKNKSIYIKLQCIEEQLSRLSERMYQPNITPSDIREIQKRKKKLSKDKSKLNKRLQSDGLS